MAILRVYQSIDNDVWKLTFVNDPNNLSDTDRRLMRQFGEPEIEVGGDFDAGEPGTFSLPTKKVKIRSDFPFVQTFDATADAFNTNTQDLIEYYRDTIVTRFTAALTDLRETPDTFTGEKTYTI
jgi:hypothetical protein